MAASGPAPQSTSLDSGVLGEAPTVTSTDPDRSTVSRGRDIGWIVAACLVIGLLVAVVLIIGPFAGAPENVISGTVLLAFALGWGLLAALSVRWSDQPQRWAIAPAGLMALAGGLLLLWPRAVTLDLFGWMWPPVVIALVVWMTLRARRQLRSRTRRWLLYPVFGVMALAALGGVYQMVSESLDRRAFPMPGELVDIGDYRLHIHCIGAGSPTVVLQDGLGEPSSRMLGWIAPPVAQDTRVCVYDRAGRGWSEAASGPQDGVAVATDLHILLERAQIAGPFVLVGHSSGGVYMRIFAERYPDQVAGMVMLDSQPNEAFTRLPDYPTFYAVYRRVSALSPSLARVGVMRLVYQSQSGGLPPRARDEETAFWSTARHNRSLRDEVAELPTALKQAQALTSLGDKPLIVVTAVKDAENGWLPLQDEMATLSSNSLHRILPDATHSSLIEDRANAALSSRAIHDVVEAVRISRVLATP